MLKPLWMRLEPKKRKTPIWSGPAHTEVLSVSACWTYSGSTMITPCQVHSKTGWTLLLVCACVIGWALGLWRIGMDFLTLQEIKSLEGSGRSGMQKHRPSIKKRKEKEPCNSSSSTANLHWESQEYGVRFRTNSALVKKASGLKKTSLNSVKVMTDTRAH